MVSVLIPTKGRPARLASCVESIQQDVEILILSTKQDDVSLSTSTDTRVQLYQEPKFTVVQAFNFLAQNAKHDIAPTSDDVQYLPNAMSFAQEMLMRKFGGNGVIGFNVINMACNDDAFVLVGKEFYDVNLRRKLFHDGYEHFFADTELGRLAKSFGKFAVCPDAKMINHHPSAGGAEDETHRFRRSEKLAHDRAVYDSRVLHGQIR